MLVLELVELDVDELVLEEDVELEVLVEVVGDTSPVEVLEDVLVELLLQRFIGVVDT